MSIVLSAVFVGLPGAPITNTPILGSKKAEFDLSKQTKCVPVQISPKKKQLREANRVWVSQHFALTSSLASTSDASKSKQLLSTLPMELQLHGTLLHTKIQLEQPRSTCGSCKHRRRIVLTPHVLGLDPPSDVQI